jgi:HK97 family phage major capsid protein
VDKKDLADLRSIDDYKAYQREISNELTALNTTYAGVPFPDAEREKFAEWQGIAKEVDARITEFEGRERVVRKWAANERNVEREDDVFRSSEAQGTRVESDIYELRTLRVDITNPEKTKQQLRDRAMKALEVATFPMGEPEKTRDHIAKLLDYSDDESGTIARRILQTGSPASRRGFIKRVMGRPLTGEEERAALTLGTTGLPVTFTLDPTILPTSVGSVNPIRAIADVKQITGKEWRGATSGAITAQYRAEGAETTDNTPTLAQPVVQAHRADVLIPYSIEVGQDFGGLQTEFGKLIADAKDDLESVKYFTGGGTNEPFGLNDMSSGTNVTTNTTNVFVAADLYKWEEALGARFRARASIVANRAIYNKIRQFDTAGGGQFWMNLNKGLPTGNGVLLGGGLLGYPSYEWSQMLTAITTTTRIALMGDFNYYVVVDRIGMDIEVIPHLFGTTANYPSGQRALFAFWRNGAAELSENAFKFLTIL